MWWQHFWNTSDICCDNHQATACSFKDSNAEWLSQTCVQKDVASAQYISDLVMTQTTKKFNSTVQVVFLDKHLKMDHTISISTNDEVDIFKLS